jgi:hypothetical protein
VTSANLLLVILIGTVVGAVVGLGLGGIIPNRLWLGIVSGFLATITAAGVREFLIRRGLLGPKGATLPGNLFVSRSQPQGREIHAWRFDCDYSCDHADSGRWNSMERERQFAGGAIATELLTSADSRLFRSGAMSVGLSLGLRSLRAVRMRCLWLRSSPRLRSSQSLCCATGLCWASALLPSVVNPKRNGPRRLVLRPF